MKKQLLTAIAISTAMFVSAQGAMKAVQISSTANDYWHVYPAVVAKDADANKTIQFSTKDVNTTFRHFGTCFNELDWHALQLLSETDRSKFFHDVFSPDGDLRFTIGRIPMGASDYAAPANFYTELYHQREEPIALAESWYSPDEMPKGATDYNMEHFTLARDRMYIIPYIKEAQRHNPDLTFWCSPWSPPQWFKHSEHYSNRPGYGNGLEESYPTYTSTQFKMDDDHLRAYARYFSTFISEYGKEGIPVTGLCYQNEAYTWNVYPNTSWKAEDTGRFNADYLIPYIRKHNPGVKVWLGTLNTKDARTVRAALDYVSTHPDYAGKTLAQMADGAGFQWEGRRIVDEIRHSYPSLEMVQTESECGGGTFDWAAGAHTFELIHHYLNSGCVDYTNWNAILAGNGRGPFCNWWQNALVHIDDEMPCGEAKRGKCTATYTPEYYAFKHYSHFISPGSKILNKPQAHIQANSLNAGLVLAVQRPDGVCVIVVGNNAGTERRISVSIDGKALDVSVPAKSMNTFLIGKKKLVNALL